VPSTKIASASSMSATFACRAGFASSRIAPIAGPPAGRESIELE